MHFCHTKYTCKHDDKDVKRFCPKFLKTTHQSHKNLLMAFNRLSTLAWIFRHTCLRGEEDTFFCITYQESLYFAHCSKSSFLSKHSTLISRENWWFFGWKTRENVVVLGFLAVDNFHFTRKIVKKKLGEKLAKMLGVCQNWIFGQKFDISNSVWTWSRARNISENCLVNANQFCAPFFGGWKVD